MFWPLFLFSKPYLAKGSYSFCSSASMGGMHNEDVLSLDRNSDFSRCAMLLNAQISGILAAT